MTRSTELELQVLVSGIRVGSLIRLPNNHVRFTPDSDWLTQGQRPPLGYAFLVDPSPRIGKETLPAWFENLLPEPGSVLRRWLCRHQGIQEADSPGLLAALGADLPGAVEVRGDPGQLEEPVFRDQAQGQMRFSLAGMQLKLSMLLRGDRFVFPAHNEHGSWIVKLPGEQFPELPEVEAATMSWARASGLRVPDFQVIGIEQLQDVDLGSLPKPIRAFAIKRFDRQEDKRVHQEDFAQALDFKPKEKYGDGPRGTSYDAAARLVGDAGGLEPQNDFVRRLAFVVGSGNDDAHLKNWSWHWGFEHRPWLSPCYDQVTTIAWPEFGWSSRRGPTLALGLGKSRRFSEIDRERLRRFAQRAAAERAAEVFLEALECMRTEWPAMRTRRLGGCGRLSKSTGGVCLCCGKWAASSRS